MLGGFMDHGVFGTESATQVAASSGNAWVLLKCQMLACCFWYEFYEIAGIAREMEIWLVFFPLPGENVILAEKRNNKLHYILPFSFIYCYACIK